jgi:hypothetical protein
MAAIYTSDYADRTPTELFFACGDRLDYAILKGDSKRIALLRYAQDTLTKDARRALEQERRRVQDNINELFRPLLEAFKH